MVREVRISWRARGVGEFKVEISFIDLSACPRQLFLFLFLCCILTIFSVLLT